uniref:LysR family transcriptional regulator n=1 Tax=Corallococcus coralloides TaxID=184914 RepID=UPI001F0C5E24|nr:LysR family transcriptional regulator [Corallococcus coralloides]
MKRAHLDEIFAFMSVVDAGSFVGGGEALGLTRSAAGKALARLESRLGVRLLNRTTRQLSLTDEGRVFHEHCQQVLAALDDAEASVGQRTGTPEGCCGSPCPPRSAGCMSSPCCGTTCGPGPRCRRR